jgi:hypothetical protein
MKMKLISTLCATALTAAMAITSFAPAQAAPLQIPVAPSASSDVINVGSGDYGGRRTGTVWQPRYYRDRSGWNHNRHGWNRDRDWRRHGGYYRDRNLGGAVIGGVITGAIVGGLLNNSRPVYRERVYRGGGDAHVQWCYDRYRTYRASDNTYVPRAGQRAYCNSPYN